MRYLVCEAAGPRSKRRILFGLVMVEALPTEKQKMDIVL
jgi:hypothetical protein